MPCQDPYNNTRHCLRYDSQPKKKNIKTKKQVSVGPFWASDARFLSVRGYSRSTLSLPSPRKGRGEGGGSSLTMNRMYIMYKQLLQPQSPSSKIQMVDESGASATTAGDAVHAAAAAFPRGLSFHTLPGRPFLECGSPMGRENPLTRSVSLEHGYVSANERSCPASEHRSRLVRAATGVFGTGRKWVYM